MNLNRVLAEIKETQIVDILIDGDAPYALVLSNGMTIEADGGEDAGGGYGFLRFKLPDGREV